VTPEDALRLLRDVTEELRGVKDELRRLREELAAMRAVAPAPNPLEAAVRLGLDHLTGKKKRR
jgi:hypothetical protein